MYALSIFSAALDTPSTLPQQRFVVGFPARVANPKPHVEGYFSTS
jgi:hypothetical protein